MLNKRNILKMVKWLCRKLSYDELLIALSFIIEVIGGLRPDVKLRKTDHQKYPNYRKFRVDPKPPRNASPDQKDYVLKGHYKKLLKDYRRQKGKELKPIRRKVIGLSNDDPESEAYRPLKQLIERLNRTYKFHTRARCGFKNLNGAIVLTTLFVTYYNFLRPHQSLRNQTPIPVDELKFVSTLQGKWVQLLKMAS